MEYVIQINMGSVTGSRLEYFKSCAGDNSNWSWVGLQDATRYPSPERAIFAIQQAVASRTVEFLSEVSVCKLVEELAVRQVVFERFGKPDFTKAAPEGMSVQNGDSFYALVWEGDFGGVRFVGYGSEVGTWGAASGTKGDLHEELQSLTRFECQELALRYLQRFGPMSVHMTLAKCMVREKPAVLTAVPLS